MPWQWPCRINIKGCAWNSLSLTTSTSQPEWVLPLSLFRTSTSVLLLGNSSQQSGAREPETKAVIENLIMKQDFSLSVALDGGSLLVTYPYDKPVQTGIAFVFLRLLCQMVCLNWLALLKLKQMGLLHSATKSGKRTLTVCPSRLKYTLR